MANMMQTYSEIIAKEIHAAGWSLRDVEERDTETGGTVAERGGVPAAIDGRIGEARTRVRCSDSLWSSCFSS